jgi:CheY-like chemotaxis protein
MIKILLVEDSKFQRLASERSLIRAGYSVITAADGEEALRLAREQVPDLILLDMLLPKISGPDVLKALKADPATRSIPVIVISSLSQKNAARLMEDGAVAFFEKALIQLEKNTDKLVIVVNGILKKRAQSQAGGR